MHVQELKRRVSAAIAKRDFALAGRLCDQAEGFGYASELLLIRGAICSAQGNLEQALLLLRQAYDAMPGRADVAYNYGVVLQQSGKIAEAVTAWESAVSSNPQNVAAWVNLALGTATLGDELAVSVYRRALAHHPRNRDLLYNHANLLYRLDRLSDSETAFTTLLENHRDDALGWTNLGMVQKAQGRFADAESSYRRAIVLSGSSNPARAYYNLANLLLQQGRWSEGFASYEWRMKLPGAIGCPWPLPRWNESLPKGSRVLLWNDQGQGDAVMYLRFASLLAAKGYRVFAYVQDAMKNLAGTTPSIEVVFSPRDDRQPMDAQLPLCSLPHALGLTSVDVWTGPYLQPPKQSAVAFDDTSPAPLRVGLVWAGNPNHDNDANRSMRLADFGPLFSLPGIAWFGLQVGSAASEIEASPYRTRIRDLSSHLADFSVTAFIMAKLDLVISVDTAPAHVAGALDKPVWTLLPAAGNDWRWGVEGNKTFWYPAMRLFRQADAGKWNPVVLKIAENLRAMLERKPLGGAQTIAEAP